MKPIMTLLAVCLLVACSQTPAPLSVYGVKPGAGSAGMHTVSSGDTLSSISKRYKVEMPEIISVNKLSSPFRLNVGQRLQLPPPTDYEVRPDDSLSEVARLFNVSQSRLVELNNLKPPYRILAGQVLRIPGLRGIEGEIMAASLAAPVMPVARSTIESENTLSPQMISIQSAPEIIRSPAQNTVITRKLAPGEFIKPVSGSIISNFGAKKNGLHNDGINIAASQGTAVIAAADGEVVYAGNELKGYGNLVLIKHAGRYMTAYGHLGQIQVKKGDRLRAGQTLGTVGSSGQVKSPQLHFEIRKGTEAVDPQKYI
jgi:murein DD-endopeptidase MepM/ murein hydrolase activator NlpD